MPLITAKRLNRYLSNPSWTEDQWEEAAEIPEEVEGELEAALNAPISAGPPVTEYGALLESGVLALSRPVAGVDTLDGTTIVADALPTGWSLHDDGCLHFADVAVGLPVVLGTRGYGGVHHAFTARTVALTYRPGWGDKPALRSAILRKSANRFLNRHDDTVTARNLTAEAPPPLTENWTKGDLDKLSVYRWHTVWR
jgi:hypothetical protein